MKVYIDMDGVLAKYNKDASFEELWEKGYFRSLPPDYNAIGLYNELVDRGHDVRILSCVLNENAADEKRGWTKEYLGDYAADHAVFVPYGEPKHKYVDQAGVLIDDFSKNLREWKGNGGLGIKYINGINNTHGTWVKENAYIVDRTTPAFMADIVEMKMSEYLKTDDFLKEQKDALLFSSLNACAKLLDLSDGGINSNAAVMALRSYGGALKVAEKAYHACLSRAALEDERCPDFSLDCAWWHDWLENYGKDAYSLDWFRGALDIYCTALACGAVRAFSEAVGKEDKEGVAQNAASLVKKTGDQMRGELALQGEKWDPKVRISDMSSTLAEDFPRYLSRAEMETLDFAKGARAENEDISYWVRAKAEINHLPGLETAFKLLLADPENSQYCLQFDKAFASNDEAARKMPPEAASWTAFDLGRELLCIAAESPGFIDAFTDGRAAKALMHAGSLMADKYNSPKDIACSAVFEALTAESWADEILERRGVLKENLLGGIVGRVREQMEEEL